MRDLKAILKYIEIDAPSQQVGHLRLDSREVTPGDVFVAIKGHQLDGGQFIAKAIENGAVAIIADRLCEFETSFEPLYLVSELTKKLPELASRFYQQPSHMLDLIGVTGTNGKSTTTAMIAHLAQFCNSQSAIIGTLGYGHPDNLTPLINTTPSSVDLQRILNDLKQQNTKLVAMEVSSHGLVQQRVAQCQFKAVAKAKHVISGDLEIGGQEHFYLETQISSVMPTEDGGMIVYTSTQNPTEVQKLVAEVIGVPMHKVVIDMRRMGGGFGGKETQAASPACMAAVIAHLTGRPTKMRLLRNEDMQQTGKRHPFYNQYTVGFDDNGVIQGADITVAGNCGYSPDLSSSIVDRAMFHSDNAYYLGDATVVGHRCKTNTASNTAYRGFGGPQGMIVSSLSTISPATMSN